MAVNPVPKMYRRVLVVEDDDAQRWTLTEILTEEGFDVVACANATQAMEQLKNDDFQVVVLDLRLPDLTGVQLLDQLGDHAAETSIIINTGHSSYQSARDALNLGVFAYVEKAGDPEELLRHVHRAMAFQLRRRAERLEAAIAESERKLSTLMANLPGMAYRCWADEAWTMQFVSEGCKTLTGYASDDLIDNRTISYNEITHPDDRRHVQAEIEKAAANGAPFEVEYRIVTAEGQEKWVWERGRFINDLGDENGVLEGFIQDVSKRKKAEEALLAYQAKLRSLASELSLAEERERRRIAGDLHDHACQSLAMSKMKLQAILEHTVPADERTLQQICGSLNETIESVRGLTFDLSSPTLYKFGLEAALDELLRDKLRAEHDITCHFSDDGLPKPLSPDVRVLLFQSVRELLINIIKHAHANTVRLDVRRENRSIRITVVDDGVGFDVEKVASAPSRSHSVGLFNVRERLDYIGGQLEVDSHPGRGSRLTLTAPLENEVDVAKEKHDGSEDSTR